MELPIVDILSWVIVSENNSNNKHKKGCPMDSLLFAYSERIMPKRSREVRVSSSG